MTLFSQLSANFLDEKKMFSHNEIRGIKLPHQYVFTVSAETKYNWFSTLD